jgi:hypothetical protein
MAVALAYNGEAQYANTKIIFLKATFTGNYGVNGTGDLLNLAPEELTANPNGISDPKLAYNLILAQPPDFIGVMSENLGGSYVQVKPNAVPTLQNFGLQMFEPGGAEKATNAAYTATELAGSVILAIPVPALQ